MSPAVMIQGELFENARLEQAFNDAIRALVKNKPVPAIQASFYPYTGLSSTIRLRKGQVYARVSDILRNAPADVLYALACILIAKLYRLRVPARLQRVYRDHSLHPSVVIASESTRRQRGFKITTSPRGGTYDLDEVFDELNAQYFNGTLQKPVLSWGRKVARRLLGHHDHVHDAIVLNPALDRRRVPRFVLEYVLYHEMLHIKHKARVVSGRTVYHSREFRSEEKRFQRFGEAVNWLEGNATALRRRTGNTRTAVRSRASGTNSREKR